MNRATQILHIFLLYSSGSHADPATITAPFTAPTVACQRPAKYSVCSARGWMKMLALDRIFCCSQRRFLFILNQVQWAHFSFMQGYLLQFFYFLKPNRGLVLDQCSQGPMFPEPFVLHINTGPSQKFQSSRDTMFPSSGAAMVPRALCCPDEHRTVTKVPEFPGPYVPKF